MASAGSAEAILEAKNRTPAFPSSHRWGFSAVFRIHDILVWVRIRGSMPLTNGFGFESGSGYFRHWPSRRQQQTNIYFCLLLSEGTFTSFIKDKKSKRGHKTVEIKIFLTIFAWSGSIPLTNGSGSRSSRHNNIRIRRIRIRIRMRNTVCGLSFFYFLFNLVYSSESGDHMPLPKICSPWNLKPAKGQKISSTVSLVSWFISYDTLKQLPATILYYNVADLDPELLVRSDPNSEKWFWIWLKIGSDLFWYKNLYYFCLNCILNKLVKFVFDRVSEDLHIFLKLKML